MPSVSLKNERARLASSFGKVVVAATLSTATVFSSLASGASAKTVTAPPISVNGSAVSIEGLERDDSVFVPVRGFFEKLGAKVTESGSSLVATRKGKELARMTVGNRSAQIDGAARTLGVAPFVAGGKVMLPLRVISEAAGASVAYTAEPRGVNVTRPTAAGAGAAAAAGAGAAAAVAAATPADVASAAPVADTQTNQSGIPWWVWALLALLLLALIVWALTRRKKEPLIATTGAARSAEPTITTTGSGRGTDPINRSGK